MDNTTCGISSTSSCSSSSLSGTSAVAFHSSWSTAASNLLANKRFHLLDVALMPCVVHGVSSYLNWVLHCLIGPEIFHQGSNIDGCSTCLILLVYWLIIVRYFVSVT